MQFFKIPGNDKLVKHFTEYCFMFEAFLIFLFVFCVLAFFHFKKIFNLCFMSPRAYNSITIFEYNSSFYYTANFRN